MTIWNGADRKSQVYFLVFQSQAYTLEWPFI